MHDMTPRDMELGDTTTTAQNWGHTHGSIRDMQQDPADPQGFLSARATNSASFNIQTSDVMLAPKKSHHSFNANIVRVCSFPAAMCFSCPSRRTVRGKHRPNKTCRL
jgi:hypothetical protein